MIICIIGSTYDASSVNYLITSSTKNLNRGFNYNSVFNILETIYKLNKVMVVK